METLQDDRLIHQETIKVQDDCAEIIATLLPSRINIKIKLNKVEKYESDFTIEDLKKQCDIFSLKNTLQKAFKVLSNVLNKKSRCGFKLACADSKAKIGMIFNDGTEHYAFDLYVKEIILSDEKKDQEFIKLEKRVRVLEEIVKEQTGEIKVLMDLLNSYINAININNKKINSNINNNINNNNARIFEINEKIDELKKTVEEIKKKNLSNGGSTIMIMGINL